MMNPSTIRRFLKTPRSVIWMLFSWHVVSTLMYVVLVLSPTIKASTADEAFVAKDRGTIIPDGDVDETDGLPSNETSEQNSTKAASCDVDIYKLCPDNLECASLRTECIQCEFNHSCVYGSRTKAVCTPAPRVNCTGIQRFEREYECRYCYQLPHWQTWCNQTTDCALNKPRSYYPAKPFFTSTCWAQSHYLCLGRRCFHKQIPCNWSEGYKWSTTLLLSIFLGGFGVDRFYLGLWKAGIGKLLSFGGLGVWTLVDVILIAVGYVGPWDGSLYI